MTKKIFIFLIGLFGVLGGYVNAQETSDSLVRLDYAKSAELLEIDGASFRKVVGPAQFMHNNTYMLCDTAYWNVDTQIIDAIGNVSLLQDGTVLTSDKMKYIVDEDLAQFRGNLVQLEDEDHNTLRTKHLDYNTADSSGVFEYGGSMRDKDGSIIESTRGTYDGKKKLFTFTDDVNMFTDSIFVKTTHLEYESDREWATFGRDTDVWSDDNMLSCNAGWYDRAREIFFFKHDVHILTADQEAWGDSLYFYRATGVVDMRGNVQVTDTTRNMSSVAGRAVYVDSLSRLTLMRDPAVLINEAEKVDTTYFRADTLIYFSVKMCDVPEWEIKDAAKRLSDLEGDPVGTYRRKAAEEAAKAAEQALQNDPNSGLVGTPGAKGGGPGGGPGGGGPAGGGLSGKGGDLGGGPGARGARGGLGDVEKSELPPDAPPEGDEEEAVPDAPPEDDEGLEEGEPDDEVEVPEDEEGSTLG